jgi:hypothetical protein
VTPTATPAHSPLCLSSLLATHTTRLVNDCPECSPTPDAATDLTLIGGVSVTCRDTPAAARSFDFETYARGDIAEVDRRSAFFDEPERNP